jgi:hypothetical protein
MLLSGNFCPHTRRTLMCFALFLLSIIVVFAALVVATPTQAGFAKTSQSSMFNKNCYINSHLNTFAQQKLQKILDYSVSEATLLAVDNGYTLQLMRSDNIDNLNRFSLQHHFRADRVAYFKDRASREKSYTLVYGHYNTAEQAKTVLAKLPSDVQKLQPSIRPMDSVRGAILSHNS